MIKATTIEELVNLIPTEVKFDEAEMKRGLIPALRLFKGRIPFLVAGGYFKDYFLEHKVKDVDVFFRNPRDYKSAKEILDSTEGYEQIYESPNAIGYSSPEGTHIEIIYKRFQEAESLVNCFDLSVTQFGISYDTKGAETYLVGDTYFQDLLNRELKITTEGLRNSPLVMFDRVLRYYSYGFWMSPEEKGKLIFKLMGMAGGTATDQKSIVESLSVDFYSMSETLQVSTTEQEKNSVTTDNAWVNK